MAAEPAPELSVDTGSLCDPEEPETELDGGIDVLEALQFRVVGGLTRRDEAEGKAPRRPKPGSVGSALSDPMPNPPGRTSPWTEKAPAGPMPVVPAPK